MAAVAVQWLEENVTRASTDKVASSEWVKFEFELSLYSLALSAAGSTSVRAYLRPTK